MAYLVVADVVMTYPVKVYVVVAYTAMAYLAMAHLFMIYLAMAYLLIAYRAAAYIAMACSVVFLLPGAVPRLRDHRHVAAHTTITGSPHHYYTRRSAATVRS